MPPDGPAFTPAVAILHVAAGTERLLSLPPQADVIPDDWSADGRWILAACRRDRRQTWGACLVPEGGDYNAIREARHDPAKNMHCLQFSPDERWVSFMAEDVGRPDVSTVYLMPPSGDPWTPLTDGRFYEDTPRWSPDGSAIYFVSPRDGTLNIWGRRIDSATGRPVGDMFRVTSFNGMHHAIPRIVGGPDLEIAISVNHLFVPLTEMSGSIWILDGVDR